MRVWETKVRVSLHDRRRRLFVLVNIATFLISTTPAVANPLNGTVAQGSAAIQHSGNKMTVTQHSQRAVINWQGFSIQPGETTQFVQPNSAAAVLNRVTGGNPSALLGTLRANGQIYLINPNGILVGAGVYNYGKIKAVEEDIFLIGATVENHGTL